MNKKTWHDKHKEESSFSQKIADKLAVYIGSWKFIIAQGILIFSWCVLNLIGWISHWDAYPFVFLNLVLAVFSVFSAPIIMMSQNRQEERDRFQAEEDLRIDMESKKDIEDLQKKLNNIEKNKIDKIIEMLKK